MRDAVISAATTAALLLFLNRKRRFISSNVTKEATPKVSIESLGYLAQSSDPGIQSNALRLLISRTLSDGTLLSLMDSVQKTPQTSVDAFERMKAVCVLRLIASNDVARRPLLKVNMLGHLVSLLDSIVNEMMEPWLSSEESASAPSRTEMIITTCVKSLNIISELVSEDDVKSMFVFSTPASISVLSKILEFDVLSGILLEHEKDACRDAVLPTLISLTSFLSAHNELRKHNLVMKLFQFCDISRARSTELSKSCLQCLYRLSSSIDESDVGEYLSPLALHSRFVPFLLFHLRQEDNETVFWTVHIMYEFTYKDICRPLFRQIPELVRLLIPLLRNEDFYLLTATMRMLCMLAYNNNDFQLKILEHPSTMERVACWMRAGNEDLQYSALLMIHNLVENAEEREHRQLLNGGVLEQLIGIINVGKSPHASYAADVIASMCTSIYVDMLDHTWWETMHSLLRSETAYLNHSASVTMQMITLGPSVISEMIYRKGVAIELKRLMLATRSKNTAESTAAALLSVSSKCPEFYEEMLDFVIKPIFEHVIHVALRVVNLLKHWKPVPDVTTAHIGIDDKNMSMEAISTGKTQKSGDEPTPDIPSDITEEEVKIFDLESAMKTLTASLSALSIFSRHRLTKEYAESDQFDSFRRVVAVVLFCAAMGMRGIYMGRAKSLYEVVEQYDTRGMFELLENEDIGNGEDDVYPSDVVESHVKDCVTMGLYILGSFFRMGIRELTAWMGKCVLNTNYYEPIAKAYAMIAQHEKRQEMYRYPQMIQFAWSTLAIIQKKDQSSLKDTLRSIMEPFAHWRRYCEVGRYVTSDGNFIASPDLTVLDGYTINNRAETFESVRFLLEVREPGKYCYEATMTTSGLVQIGWASAQCEFDPDGGTGVGDDDHSYAYDGIRRKRWHGRMPASHHRYGMKWKIGSVITCGIDTVEGTLRFWQDGIDLGIAFCDVDVTQTWYPALSFSSGQGCDVNLGDGLRSLRYTPLDYVPIGGVSIRHERDVDWSLIHEPHFSIRFTLPTKPKGAIIGFVSQNDILEFLYVNHTGYFIGQASMSSDFDADRLSVALQHAVAEYSDTEEDAEYNDILPFDAHRYIIRLVQCQGHAVYTSQDLLVHVKDGNHVAFNLDGRCITLPPADNAHIEYSSSNIFKWPFVHGVKNSYLDFRRLHCKNTR